MTKAILQEKACSIREKYQWGRFRELGDRLTQRETKTTKDSLIYHAGHEMRYIDGARGPEPNSKRTGLEPHYREFLDFIISGQVPEWGVPRPWNDHLNFLRTLSDKRRHNDPVTSLDFSLFSKDYATLNSEQRRFIINPFNHFLYANLGEDVLDMLVFYLEDRGIRHDELPLVLPVYLPEVAKIYEQVREEDTAKAFWNFRSDYDEEIQQKIPIFPPEVHNLRMRVLTDTLQIMNRIYKTTNAYVQKIEELVKSE